MNHLFRLAVVGLCATVLIMPTASAAQSPAPTFAPAQDWVVTRLRERDTLIASASFDNGITIAARCSGKAFALILTGLPEVDRSETMRQLILLVGEDAEEHPYTWTVASDRTVAFSRAPAILTRRLIEGGVFQVIVPGEPGGPRTRYVMSLSPSESALQQALTHCDRPVENPRDATLIGDAKGLPTGLTWERMPVVEFPSASVHGASNGGSVTMSCLVGSGRRLCECICEDEFPAGFNLSQAVRRSLGAARIGQNEEARAAGIPLEGQMVLFTVLFAVARD